MSPAVRSIGLVVNIVRADHDGVTIIIDGTEVFDGGEHITHRTRIVAEEPTVALDWVANAIWPHREFHILEKKEDEVPQ